MHYEMKLYDEYFELVRKKIKKYEIRLNDEKRKVIEKGDTINFSNYSFPNKYITVVVKEKQYFHSFEDILNYTPLNSIGFLGESIESALDKIYKIYNENEERKLGVILLKIEPILIKNTEYNKNTITI